MNSTSRILRMCGLAVLLLHSTAVLRTHAAQYSIDILINPYHPEMFDSWLFGINNEGQTTGYTVTRNAANRFVQNVVTYRAGTAQTLYTGTGSPAGLGTTGFAINAGGDVVGNTDYQLTFFAASGGSTPIAVPGFDFPTAGGISATYPYTYANDVSADSQVGTGLFSLQRNGTRHALLWHGTAASVVDLNPAGFTQTEAYGVTGTIQVGYGKGTATGSQTHAMLWQSSVASFVDLHTLLAGLGHTFTGSTAMDISANGVIVGYAGDSNNVAYAVKWTPIIPGDYNGDAIVDAADYVVSRSTLGSTADLRANGDVTGASASKIDGADYAVWRASFGRTAGGGAGAGAVLASAVVPEPSSVVGLLACAVVGIVLGARETGVAASTTRSTFPDGKRISTP